MSVDTPSEETRDVTSKAEIAGKREIDAFMRAANALRPLSEHMRERTLHALNALLLPPDTREPLLSRDMLMKLLEQLIPAVAGSFSSKTTQGVPVPSPSVAGYTDEELEDLFDTPGAVRNPMRPQFTPFTPPPGAHRAYRPGPRPPLVGWLDLDDKGNVILYAIDGRRAQVPMEIVQTVMADLESPPEDSNGSSTETPPES